METHETKLDQVEMLIKYLTRGRDDMHIYRDKCKPRMLSLYLCYSVRSGTDLISLLKG